jgi:hypothetical protein
MRDHPESKYWTNDPGFLGSASACLYSVDYAEFNHCSDDTGF